MKISRCGSQRFHKITVLIDGLSFKTDEEHRWKNNVEWDARAKQLIIRHTNVLHTDGITRHDYTIRLTLEDISSLIGLLGHAGSVSDASLLRDHLAKHVPAIVKLLACATGAVPVPIEVTGNSKMTQTR